MEKVKEKGMTLTEVVISMAIFTIISGAIFFTCNFASKSQSNNNTISFFESEVECVETCLLSQRESSLSPLDENSKTLLAIEFLVGDKSNFEVDSVSRSLTIFYNQEKQYTIKEGAQYYLTVAFDENGEITDCQVKSKAGETVISKGAPYEV